MYVPYSTFSQFIVEFSLSGYFLSSLGSTDCVIFVAEYSDIFSSLRSKTRVGHLGGSLLYSYVSLVSYIVSCQIWRVTLRFCHAALHFWRPIYFLSHFYFEIYDKKYIFASYYIIYGIYKKPTCHPSKWNLSSKDWYIYAPYE